MTALDKVLIGGLGACAIMAMSTCAVAAFLPTAKEVRLIGECGGTYYAAMEEDMFPQGCEWIEPIRVDVQ